MRDFAYTERARRNTKHVKDRHRHGLCNIAREKAERKRSLNIEIYHSAGMGIRRRRRGNVGRRLGQTEASDNRCGEYTCQELTYTAYGKAEEGKGKQKKTVQPSVLVQKDEIDRRKANVYERFCRSLMGGRKQSSKEKTQKEDTKTLRASPPVS